jgi:uncharacterized protein YjbJ (UPF0337 family)
MNALFNRMKGIADMNWDEIRNNWKTASDQIKRTWGKLTEDDLTAIAGRRGQLVVVLQERYGYDAAHAQTKVDEFAQRLKR